MSVWGCYFHYLQYTPGLDWLSAVENGKLGAHDVGSELADKGLAVSGQIGGVGGHQVVGSGRLLSLSPRHQEHFFAVLSLHVQKVGRVKAWKIERTNHCRPLFWDTYAGGASGFTEICFTIVMMIDEY